MKSNIELIEDIKRDKTKREFFLKKVKDSIEKYSFNFTNQELEELLDEAIENYNDSIKITLIFYLTAYIKKRLEEKKGNQEKSKLFTWEEIAIINQYLENNNGQYQYLAVIKMNNKFIDIDVNAVIKKFKNLVVKNESVVEEIFPNAKKRLKQRILFEKNGKVKKISAEDLELLGYFTGQINDICLDVEELAAIKDYSELTVKTKLIDIYSCLDDENNLLTVTTKYPNIIEMLIIRSANLNITLPTSILEFQLNQDVNFLRHIYSKDNEGNFRPLTETASKLNLSYIEFIKKKEQIENKIKTTPKYKFQILKIYPTYSKDKKEFNLAQNTKKIRSLNKSQPRDNHPEKSKINIAADTNSPNKNFAKYLEILKLIYLPTKDGVYLDNYQEMAKLSNMEYRNFIKVKNKILKLVDSDYNFRNFLLDNWPTFFADRKLKIQIHPTTQFDKDIKFLKYILKYNNGRCLTIKQLAEEINTEATNMTCKIINLFKKINEDSEFEKEILAEIPDFKKRVETFSKTCSITAINNYLNKYSTEETVMINILEKDEDGLYKTIKEIAKICHVSITEVYRVKNKILALELPPQTITDKTYIAQLEKKYPLFQEMLRKRKEFYKNQELVILENEKRKFRDELIPFIKELIEQDENGKYKSVKDLATEKNLSETKVKNTIKKFYTLLNKNVEFKQLLEKYYPDFSQSEINYSNINDDLDNFIGYKKQIKLLKAIYLPNENGTYTNLIERANSLNMSYATLINRKKRILNLIATNEKFRKDLLDSWPTFFEDKEKYESINKTIIKDINFLKSILQYDENGNCFSITALTKKLNVSHPNVLTIKIRKIINEINNFPEIKALVLKSIPDFEIRLKNFSKVTKIKIVNQYFDNEEIYSKNLEFIKLYLKKDSENFYFSINNIARIQKKSPNNIFLKKKRVFNNFLQDIKFREYIKTNAQELYSELEFLINLEDDNFFLQTILQKDENGELSPLESTAQKIHIRLPILNLRKAKIMKKAARDETYRKKLLEQNPNLEEEILKLDNLSKKDQQLPVSHKNKNFEYYYKVLQVLTENPTGNLSINKAINTLNIDIQEFVNLQNKIFTLLDTNNSFINFIKKKNPEMLDLITTYRKQSYDLSNSEKAIVDKIFGNQTRIMKGNKTIAQKLNFNVTYFSHLKSNISFKLMHNTQLTNVYPTEITNALIQNNYASSNSISIAEDQLQKMKETVSKLDIPNYKDENALKTFKEVIKNLNKSVYHDYVELCNYEQKIILALRFGFFNETIYSTTDVAKICNVSTQYVDLLVNECIKLCKKNFNTFKSIVKTKPKN